MRIRSKGFKLKIMISDSRFDKGLVHRRRGDEDRSKEVEDPLEVRAEREVKSKREAKLEQEVIEVSPRLTVLGRR